MTDELSGVVEGPSFDEAHPRPFAVRLEADADGGCVVLVSGDVDVATGGELRTVLATAVESSRRIVIDLAGVAFMDSTGLNAIVRARQQAEAGGAELAVRGAGPVLVRLFEISGIDALMEARIQ